MKRIKLSLIALSIIASCSNPEKLAHRAIANKESYDILKKEVARLEPCVEKDPIILPGKETIIEKQSNLDSINSLISALQKLNLSDSTKSNMIAFLLKNCSKTKEIIRVDTFLKEDTRMVNILNGEIAKMKGDSYKESLKLQNELSKSKASADKSKGERNTAYLVIAALVLLLIFTFKIK